MHFAEHHTSRICRNFDDKTAVEIYFIILVKPSDEFLRQIGFAQALIQEFYSL